MVSLIDIFGKKQPLLRAAVCHGLSAFEKGIYRILDRKRREEERGGERRRERKKEERREKRGSRVETSQPARKRSARRDAQACRKGW